MIDTPDSYENPDKSYRWPYEHLALRQPRCPGCDGPPHAELIDKSIPPLYFCINDDCSVRAWDPSRSHSGPRHRKEGL